MFARLPLLSVLALGTVLAFVACSVRDTPVPSSFRSSSSSLSETSPSPAAAEGPAPDSAPVTVITPEEKREIVEEVAKLEPVDDPADPGRTVPDMEEMASAEKVAKVLTPADFPEYTPDPLPPPAADFAALREECTNTCCLASVIFMETGNHALATAKEKESASGGCPAGQVANSLKCPSSYRWCESAMVSANP